jgi:uncharacterized protein (TIGR02246 family)
MIRRSRFALPPVVLVLTCASAFGGPIEDVGATTDKWGAAFSELNADKIASLYAADAVLWGTFAPYMRNDPSAIREYFAVNFKGRSNANVSFGPRLVRVYGNTANSSGTYTISFVLNGESRTRPARYSFTYRKDGDSWFIVDHHSSALPPPPK